MSLKGVAVDQHKFIYKFSMAVKVNMFSRVVVLVFLFFAGISFPKAKSIATVIRSRYVDKPLKIVRKSEKLDFKLRNAKCDSKFLCECENNDLISNFLCFRTDHKNLKDYNKMSIKSKKSSPC